MRSDAPANPCSFTLALVCASCWCKVCAQAAASPYVHLQSAEIYVPRLMEVIRPQARVPWLTSARVRNLGDPLRQLAGSPGPRLCYRPRRAQLSALATASHASVRTSSDPGRRRKRDELPPLCCNATLVPTRITASPFRSQVMSLGSLKPLRLADPFPAAAEQRVTSIVRANHGGTA